MVPIELAHFIAKLKKDIAIRVSPDQQPPKQKKSLKIALLVFFCVVFLVMVGAVGFLGFSSDDRLIFNNIVVYDTNLGGMTKDQAKTAIHKMTDSTYTRQDLVVNVNGTEIHFSPADTGAVLDVETMVKDAYSYGRNGRKTDREAVQAQLNAEPYELDPLNYLTLNTEAIRSILDANLDLFQSEYIPSSMEILGDMPILDAAADDFDPEAEPQTLVLTIGNPGRSIDVEQVYNQIMKAYRLNDLLVVIDTAETDVTPDAIDLEAVFEEYNTEFMDAEIDLTTHKVIPEIYGYTFDLEQAMADLAEAKYGDVIEIPFQLVAPEMDAETLESLLFRDVLATYSTKHSENAPRTNNLKLACKAINGKILNPGEVFDYNTTLGMRTAAAGYQAAPAYNSGVTVNELGGGICQVSSTLYYCTLLADLKIVTRTNHSYVSSYIPYGMDATVSWGGPHFRFENNTNYPIRLEAYVANGYVTMSIIGTDEKDYYVEMEYEIVESYGYEEVIETMTESEAAEAGYADGDVIQSSYNGYKVNTYKVKYSKETGEKISREFEALSKYKARNKIILSVIPDPTEAPSDTPTEAPNDPPSIDVPEDEF